MLNLRDFDGGDGDLAMFRRAFEAGTKAVAGKWYVQEVVDVPPDKYTVDGPIDWHSTNRNTHPPALVCRGLAVVYYDGPPTEEYMLKMGGTPFVSGGGGASHPMIKIAEGIRLEGGFNCRGLSIDYAPYGATMDRMNVSHTWQSAFSIHDCWGSTFTNLHANNVKGSAFYATNFNSSSLAGFKVSTKNEDWHADIPKAVMFVQGGTSYFQEICMEDVHCGDKPVIQLQGHNGLLTGIRFEGVEATESLIELLPNAHNFGIDHVQVMPKLAEAKRAIAIGGACYQNTISNVSGVGLSDCIAEVMGAEAFDNRVLASYVHPQGTLEIVPSMINKFGPR